MKYNNIYQGDRFVGLAAPFVLGALTGGITYAAFNPYKPRPTYPYNPYYYGYQMNNPYYY